MENPKIRCWNCGVPSKFGERTREIEGDLTEVYIKCPTCRKEKVVFTAQSSIIKQYRKLLKLKGRFKDDPKQLRLINKQLSNLLNGKAN